MPIYTVNLPVTGYAEMVGIVADTEEEAIKKAMKKARRGCKSKITLIWRYREIQSEGMKAKAWETAEGETP